MLVSAIIIAQTLVDGWSELLTITLLLNRDLVAFQGCRLKQLCMG